MTTPLYIQTKAYTARMDRQLIEQSLKGEGFFNRGDFRLTPTTGLNFTIAPGTVIVRGDSNAYQGLYAVTEEQQQATGLTAADSTNPRIDSLYIRVYDNPEDASGLASAVPLVVTGTPTGGASLDNRNGAAAAPVGAAHICDFLVPSSFSGPLVDGTNIRYRRPFIVNGVIPPILTDVDMVAFEPVNGIPKPVGNATYNHTNHDTHQSAALMWLPRRIASATRIRWKYQQGATAVASGGYNIGIYDASARLIISTGAVSATGAANSLQPRSETITATSFDAGLYYVCGGWDTGTASSTLGYIGVDISIGATTQPGAAFPNVALRTTSGGQSLPNTLLGFTDVSGLTTASSNIPPIPMVALSVG
jgi:hypothetical protein